jgi:putative cell wall-binding protein
VHRLAARLSAAALSALIPLTALAQPAAGRAGEDVVLLVGAAGAGASAAIEAAGAEVIDGIESIGLRKVRVPAARAAAAAVSLGASNGIAFAERETRVTAVQTPTDQFFQHQWGAEKVEAPTAWDTTVGTSNVIIAILDTGVSPHDEFSGKLLPGADLVNDDSDAADDNGHGTAAAAVAAADANDAGIAGLCWECRILPVKVLDAAGAGGTFTVAEGIVFAADNGADVINLSLGGPSQSLSVDNAVAYARSKGAIVVAAAGNESSSTPTFPAASPGVISVGATDENDQKFNFSNFGSWVKVAAPGCNPAPELDGSYSMFCGTSSATPLASGVIGLALSVGAAPTTIETVLLSSADPVGSFVAHGRINAAALLEALGALPDPGPDPEPEPDPEPTPEPTLDIERIAGGDRIGTSVALARKAFPSGADAVVLARADDYADALAAAPLAKALGAPVLLASGTTLPADVQAVVDELGASTAVLIGGERALPSSLLDGLAAAGVTEAVRIAGFSRFDTAALIAAELVAAGADRVYIAEGANPDPNRGWPDAVAVSALAATEGNPVLLVTRDSVPQETLSALSQLGISSATVVGGPVAVSDAVLAQLRTVVPSVERVAGASRYATSRLLADRTLAAGGSSVQPFIATGRSFPDALAAGPAAAALGSVLLLVDGADLAGSPDSLAWLTEQLGVMTSVIVVGGAASVSGAVETQVSTLGS